MKDLIISADDYGLTQQNTDSILETVDHGPVRKISILANGEAFEYSIQEYAKRKDLVRISIHLNLTEGKQVSSERLSLLASNDGDFKNSPGSLLLTYLFADSVKRKELERQVGIEFAAQVEKVKAALRAHNIELIEADGHQHVHMIPFVFNEVLEIENLERVRIVNEPWHAIFSGSFKSFGPRAVILILLNTLGRYNRKQAEAKNIHSNNHFLGFLFSGKMSYGSVEAGLGALEESNRKGSLEILFHPGSADCGEFKMWKKQNANLGWHLSKWREKERLLLLGDRFKRLVKEPAHVHHLGVLMRFGISGSIVAVVDLSLLYIFTDIFGIWYLASATLAFCVAFVVSFSLQKFWTFKNKTMHILQAPIYLGLQLVDLGINAVLLYVAVDRYNIPYLVAQFFIFIIMSIWSFLLMKYVIFPTKPLLTQTL